jgi:anti-sigma regulatory factor (Ser/Thr protein kinase)
MRVLGIQRCHKIGEISETSSARRAGIDMSKALGFSEVRSGEVAIVITEAATNISKHAVSGCIYLRSISINDNHGIEVIAVDSGPGMRNIELNFEDGNSTSGTYGAGLGAIKRLSHHLDFFTEPGKGTVLMMILWDNPDAISNEFWEIGSMCIPIPSEYVCGDAWVAVESTSGINLMVADGLGHGPEAAEASNLAVKAMEEEPELNSNRLLQNCHGYMRGSRGGAVAISKINIKANELRYCGVGNIAGSIYSTEKRKHLISHNGIVGTNMLKTHEFIEKWSDDSILIMHSDGIGTKWGLENYKGLERCHSSVIAAVIHRDFTRGRDDSTIVVLKST